MKREQMKKMLPILQAYAEGKTVQTDFARKGEWLNKTELYDTDLIAMSYDPVIYRIKPEPEPKYRPFRDAEECWQEMQKHQPFGWIKSDDPNIGFVQINQVEENQRKDDELLIWYAGSSNNTAEEIFKFLTFADGEPFGAKEEDV